MAPFQCFSTVSLPRFCVQTPCMQGLAVGKVSESLNLRSCRGIRMFFLYRALPGPKLFNSITYQLIGSRDDSFLTNGQTHHVDLPHYPITCRLGQSNRNDRMIVERIISLAEGKRWGLDMDQDEEQEVTMT